MHTPQNTAQTYCMKLELHWYIGFTRPIYCIVTQSRFVAKFRHGGGDGDGGRGLGDGGGGEGLVGGGDGMEDGAGGFGSSLEAKSTGNHCGGTALLSNLRAWAVTLGLDEVHESMVLVPAAPRTIGPVLLSAGRYRSLAHHHNMHRLCLRLTTSGAVVATLVR